VFLFCLLISAALSLVRAEEPPLRWLLLPNPQMEVDGLPWYSENGGELFRLPAKLKDTYRKPVWDLAQSPSGGRIRCRTNSTTLAIRLEYPGPPGMSNMHAFGQTGVDLYADGVYRGTAIAGREAKAGATKEHVYFKQQPDAFREITLYLPLYMGVKVLGIGVDPEARIERAKPFAPEARGFLRHIDYTGRVRQPVRDELSSHSGAHVERRFRQPGILGEWFGRAGTGARSGQH
jgi:hypothetical protein